MAQKERVELHFKLSLPFSCLLMMLIGAPLSLYLKKNILIVSFGLTLLGYIIYWALLSVGMSLGKNGVLSPFLSVWLNNFIFILISIYIHKKAVN
jgi:lipopolysaccharide export system permease protein